MGTLVTIGPQSSARGSIATERSGVLIWIDTEEAVIVRWRAGQPSVERVRSDVPGRRRSTGHVRHDPLIRHGGGGRPQTAGQPRRVELLRQFVRSVVARIGPNVDVLLIGPGSVRRHVQRALGDTSSHEPRAVSTEPAGRMTDPQLVARLREFIDATPERRVVGTGITG